MANRRHYADGDASAVDDAASALSLARHVVGVLSGDDGGHGDRGQKCAHCHGDMGAADGGGRLRCGSVIE